MFAPGAPSRVAGAAHVFSPHLVGDEGTMQFGNTGKSAKRNLHRLFSATRGLKRRRSAPLTGPAAARAVEPLECRRLLAAVTADKADYGFGETAHFTGIEFSP